jgi:hypothetical protein
MSETRALEAAIAATAVALAIAALACEGVVAPWAAAWGYLVAVALATWVRSAVVVPIAVAGIVVPIARGDATVASALAQVAILAIVIPTVARIRVADRASGSRLRS